MPKTKLSPSLSLEDKHRRCDTKRGKTEAAITSSSPTYEHPLLFFPALEHKTNKSTCHFLDLEDKTLLTLENKPKPLSESCCIGSSHGWLLFLDELAIFLLNPATHSRIELPSIKTFLGIVSIDKKEGEFDVLYKDSSGSSYMPRITTKQLRERFIDKAILSTMPLINQDQSSYYQVALICGFDYKLAYYQSRHQSWSELEGNHAPYCDIMFSENKLYAASHGGFLEVWDYNQCDGAPIKTMDIKPSFELKTTKRKDYSNKDLYTSRVYLVESCRYVLLVERYIGEFVNGKGQAIRETDLLSSDDTQPLVCPYKTLYFSVYKLDLKHNQWVEIESLGNQTLFVGGNHSMSMPRKHLSKIEKDAIYFTDDNWLRMNEDYSYGGHDMGVYSLKKQEVRPFCRITSLRIQPPPSWIFRN